MLHNFLRRATHLFRTAPGTKKHARADKEQSLVSLDLVGANADGPAAVFRDIATALIPVAARALRQQGEAVIRLRDATAMQLKGDDFSWGEVNARTRGLKSHLLYDPRQTRAVWFDVTSAKIDDVVAGRGVSLEPGATYVFDKGYTDYRWWSDILTAGAFFITRRKRNACCRPIANRAPQATASWPTACCRSATSHAGSTRLSGNFPARCPRCLGQRAPQVA